MSDGLYLSVLAKIEHTVYSRTHGHAPGIGMCNAKGIESRSGVRDDLLGYDVVTGLVLHYDGITILIYLIFKILPPLREHPVHAVRNVGAHIDVLEQGKAGKAYLEVVRHAVGHLVQDLRAQGVAEFLDPVCFTAQICLISILVSVHHIVLDFPQFEINPVLERGVVTKGYLLIEPFLTHPLLALEGIETVHGEGDVGEGEGITGVARVLVVHGVHAQVELAVPVMRIGDGGSNLVLLGLLDRRGVVAVVGGAGEVHGSRKGSTGVGLGILGVGPFEAEVTGLHKVLAAFFAGLVIGNG